MGEHEDGPRTDVFLQWKGTDACFDFNCKCGVQSHFDGFFANYVKCPACEQVYAMPSFLFPEPIAEHHGAEPVVPSVDD